ncbi:MAG: hypothetical protein K2K44_01715 [Oscillospiraceae bacterium]|nr:hypothetical protein [Oscillospiraceae bacterium]
MKKKTLGRVTALSLAALTAVPAFSIVASAATMTFPELYEVTYIEVNGTVGTIVTEYYDTQAAASSAASGKKYNGADAKANRVTNIAAVFSGSNNKFDYNNGKVTPNKDGAHTYGGSSAGSSTGTGRIDTAPSSYYYATDYYYVVIGSSFGYVYPNPDLAKWVEGSNVTLRAEPINTTKYSASTPYFDYNQGAYANTSAGTTVYIYSSNSSISSNYYSSTYRYYSSYTGLFYTSSEAARIASNNNSNYVTDYYTTSSSVRSYAYPYYSSYTGRYYATREAAIIASGDNSSYVSQGVATGSYTVYYSPYTGKYYDTWSAASAATPASSGYTVRTITNSAYTASYLNTYGYNYGYYNGYYNGYGYYDPTYYYYYYLMGNNGTAAATQDTSTVTIGNYKGWTNVVRVINNARSGASYAVSMKSETEIPENVLKAMKGKNVNILFTFSNGAVITINGNDITSTTAFSPNVVYGSTSIPSSLKKKAVKANSGVSSSQFTISGGTFGADVSVTVKFNSKRAGCSAKLYRYNASANTLSLVSRSAVQSNGQCKFDDVKQGGEYIVVLS